MGGAGPAFLSPGRGYALVFQGGGEININGGTRPLHQVAGKGDGNLAAGTLRLGVRQSVSRLLRRSRLIDRLRRELDAHGD